MLLATVLVLAASAYIVMSDNEEFDAGSAGDHLDWRVEGTTLIITGYGDMRDYSTGLLPYPWYIDYWDVVEYIQLNEGITSITKNCFQFPNLKGEIVLPKSLKTIGVNVFKGSKITNVVFPDDSQLTSISMGAFKDCTELTGTLKLPKNLTYIGSEAFMNCPKLTGSIQIPDGVSIINSGTFQGCSSLTGELKLPANLLCIGWYAFDGCSGLTGNINLPEQFFAGFGNCSFRGCTGLTGALVAPNDAYSVTPVGESGFEGCTGITSIKLYKGNIDDRAFAGCTGLTTVSLGKNLGDISPSAFQGITFYDEDGTEIEINTENYSKLKGYVFEGPNGKLTKVAQTDDDIPDKPDQNNSGIDLWMVATPIAFILGIIVAMLYTRRLA